VTVRGTTVSSTSALASFIRPSFFLILWGYQPHCRLPRSHDCVFVFERGIDSAFHKRVNGYTSFILTSPRHRHCSLYDSLLRICVPSVQICRDTERVKREWIVAGANFCVGRFASGLQCTTPSLPAALVEVVLPVVSLTMQQQIVWEVSGENMCDPSMHPGPAVGVWAVM